MRLSVVCDPFLGDQGCLVRVTELREFLIETEEHLELHRLFDSWDQGKLLQVLLQVTGPFISRGC